MNSYCLSRSVCDTLLRRPRGRTQSQRTATGRGHFSCVGPFLHTQCSKFFCNRVGAKTNKVQAGSPSFFPSDFKRNESTSTSPEGLTSPGHRTPGLTEQRSPWEATGVPGLRSRHHAGTIFHCVPNSLPRPPLAGAWPRSETASRIRVAPAQPGS